MRRGRRAVTLTLGVAALAVAASLQSGGATTPSRYSLLRERASTVSANWAGYVVRAPAGAADSTFTDVVGTWVQPRLSCAKGRAASSGFWVGLGGASDSSTALEQTGTAANCTSAGRAVYYAWMELVPDPPVPVRLAVAPGNRILGAVAFVDGRVVLELKNLTRGTSATRSVAVEETDLTSAEWIAEAPSLCTSALSCRVDRLANFRQVVFSQAAATADGHTGTIADPAWDATQITLAPGTAGGSFAALAPDDDAGAIPSPLGEDGRSFSVTWSQHVATQ
jgi:hypothetical protein